MTLKFFCDNYDLKDYEIKACEIKDGKLTLDVNVIAYLELIANGYRPELEVSHEINFIFEIDHEDYKFKKPVFESEVYKDGILYLNISGKELKIEKDYINVVQKI